MNEPTSPPDDSMDFGPTRRPEGSGQPNPPAPEPKSKPDAVADDLDFGQTMIGFQPGQRFFGSRYRLVRQLGRGGMGVVWLAMDEELKDEVALKFLPPETLRDDGALEDLRRETLRSRKLSHPNIVKTYEFLREGTFGAISMEFVDGCTLGKIRGQQEEGALPADFPGLKKWLLQLCEALAYAHETVKVAHRDLKPSNLMIDADGNLKVADFGIARSLTESRTRLSRAVQNAAGTLVYMSPQQLEGGAPSIADDVYSFGATVFELLTSKPPFYHGENIPGQIRTVVPPAMAQRRRELGVTADGAIPAAWEGLIARCLEKDTRKRPATFGEIREVLTASKLPTRKPALKRRVAVLAAVASVAIGGGIWWKAAQQEEIRPIGPISQFPPTEDPAAKAENILASGEIGKGVEFKLPGGKPLTLRYIPGGTFTMGSPKTEDGRKDNEGPVMVTLSSHFWLAETELTQAQWEALIENNPSHFKGADKPVELVSWEDADGFMKKLNAVLPLPAGWMWSLPTEAQWERACRGGATTVFGFGDTLTSQQANIYGDSPYGTTMKGPNLGQTRAVKGYPANGYGLYDMHGNVWEWCADAWDGNSNLSGGTDPQVREGSFRVFRGGSWIFFGLFCRSAFRSRGAPDRGISDLGFRPAAVSAGTQGVERKRVAEEAAAKNILASGEIGKGVEFKLPGGKPLTLRYIPGGTFTMGSPKTEAERSDDEGPVTVTLSSHFWLAETELTQGQWEAVMESNPSKFKGAEKPVENVSWKDADGFMTKLNAAVPLPVGWEWRLPTEAQWERACRGGTTTAFSFGDTATSKQANFAGNYPYGTAVKGPDLEQTTAVKSYPANAYGLYDMHGNVWEWCADWYGKTLEGGRDPRGAGSGSSRVFRGGSWFSYGLGCRCAFRLRYTPDSRILNFGFRPAAVPAGR